MDDIRKILAEYKLSAKDVLFMIAKRLGYDSIEIINRSLLRDQSIFELQFYKELYNGAFTTTISSCLWISNETYKIPYPDFTASIRKTNACNMIHKEDLFEELLEMLFKYTMLGSKVSGYTGSFGKRIYTTVLHPFDTLESFLIDFELENEIC